MKITITVKRPNGTEETKDCKYFSQNFLDQAYIATKNAGKGEILNITKTEMKSNMKQLVRDYNNLNNEGGEGYVPDSDYFTKLPEFKSWLETSVITPN